MHGTGHAHPFLDNPVADRLSLAYGYSMSPTEALALSDWEFRQIRAYYSGRAAAENRRQS